MIFQRKGIADVKARNIYVCFYYCSAGQPFLFFPMFGNLKADVLTWKQVLSGLAFYIYDCNVSRPVSFCLN